MDLARTPSALGARPRRFPWLEARRKGIALLQAAVFHLVGGTLLLSLMILAYVIKRTLGLDLVPGVDMLPDPEIEAALEALVSLLGG
ncbi:hypothetical protein E2C06_26405 [Dankookia rubra]|uniref:Uncharacterized protein n=1 Tax=Dankookia rubra TaxID=1442381 RepID=A0A4R5QBJ4_9PROT|nr:hypothetical protein [Dankookia rubra]TDH59637.1 hypothetical protein E2C06_26405 [Dankookia rubra]